MADYTKGMSALHHILTQTPMNTTLSKKGQLPPFTASHLKAGLRTSWTAEQIGRLAIKYESEWYADSSLSKWNEIDHFYQTACENKRQRILTELDECHITKPAEREYPLKLLNAQYQSHIDTWQIEKAQRIKPSLWWDEVAKAQASQTTNTDTATTDNTPVLSNLSLDGKAWYLHPVGMMGFVVRKINTLSVLGINFLKIWEGSRLKPYDDQTGKTITTYVTGATIGVGHLIVSEIEFENYKDGINEVAVNELLSTDLNSKGYIKVVVDHIKTEITQYEFDALVVFAFNIGINAFKNSTVVKMINNPEKNYSYNTLEDAWLSWSKSQGKFNQGVNNRRKAEYYLFVTGKYTRYNHKNGEYTEI